MEQKLTVAELAPLHERALEVRRTIANLISKYDEPIQWCGGSTAGRLSGLFDAAYQLESKLAETIHFMKKREHE